MLPVPVGVQESGPVGESRVVDEMIHGESVRHGVVVQVPWRVGFAQVKRDRFHTHMVAPFQCTFHFAELALPSRGDDEIVVVRGEQRRQFAPDAA